MRGEWHHSSLFCELLYMDTHFLDDIFADKWKTLYFCSGIINH